MATNKDAGVPISTRIEESLRDDLAKLAAHNDRTFAGEVRRALRLYVMGQNFDISRLDEDIAKLKEEA